VRLTDEESADIARKFENFSLSGARIYDLGDELPPRIALIQAQARADYYRGEADRLLFEAVSDARAHGESWASIGQVFGLTGDAAQQRFERDVLENA